MNKELDNSEPVAPLVEAATVEPTSPEVVLARAPFLNPLLKPAFWIVLLSLLAGLYVQSAVDPHWREVKTTYQTGL